MNASPLLVSIGVRAVGPSPNARSVHSSWRKLSAGSRSSSERWKISTSRWPNFAIPCECTQSGASPGRGLQRVQGHVVADVEVQLGDLPDVLLLVELEGAGVEQHSLPLLEQPPDAPQGLEDAHRGLAACGRLVRQAVEAPGAAEPGVGRLASCSSSGVHPSGDSSASKRTAMSASADRSRKLPVAWSSSTVTSSVSNASPIASEASGSASSVATM